MKKNLLTTVLMAMSMAVISNTTSAAVMNNDVCLSKAASYRYVTPASVTSSDEELLVDAATTERVKARSTDRYTHRFYSGETVYIGVRGDGDTDLDLYVYDENGNLIDSDTDSGDDCLCIFTPKWTGRFTIMVKNLGDIYNEYRIRFVQ